jgi:hypothetical protein
MMEALEKNWLRRGFLLVLGLQIIGYLWFTRLNYGGLANWVFQTFAWGPSYYEAVSQGVMVLLLMAALGLTWGEGLVRTSYSAARIVLLSSALLLSGLYFMEAIFVSAVGGAYASEWTVLAHSLRYAAPLCMIGLLLDGPQKARIASVSLRWALALTFIVHGWEAWKGHPQFVDFVLGFSERQLNLSLTEQNALSILRFIGAMDLAAGALSLWRPRPWLFLIMGIWGTVTAVNRLYFSGFHGLDECLMRITHCVVPFYFARGSKRHARIHFSFSMPFTLIRKQNL